MSLKEIIHKQFIDEVLEKYGLNQEEAGKILRKNGYDVFQEDQVDEYKRIIAESAVQTVKTLQSDKETRQKAWSATYEPCAVADCKGRKIRVRNGWKCSEGGSLHYHAWRVAGIACGKDASAQQVSEKARNIIKQVEELKSNDEADKGAESSIQMET